MAPFRIDGPVGMRPVRAEPALPELEPAPPRALIVEASAIGERRRRVPVVLAAWTTVLTAVVALGLLAQGPVPAETGTDGRGDAAIRTEPPATPVAPTLARDVVELESPGPARVEVTSRVVAVAGTVLVNAERVEIVLEARRNRVVIGRKTIDVTDPDGGIRPEQTPRFATTFDLPSQRSSGTMWIIVTAYDNRGLPLGDTTRPFQVGPLVEPDAPGGNGAGANRGTIALDTAAGGPPYGGQLDAALGLAPSPSPCPPADGRTDVIPC